MQELRMEGLKRGILSQILFIIFPFFRTPDSYYPRLIATPLVGQSLNSDNEILCH